MVVVSVFVRRDADSGGKLSTSTIIIIAAVSGSVVILVLALFAWRLLVRYCRRSKTVPLPPVQDLAHHREHQLAAYADHNGSRPTTLVEPKPRLYAAHYLSATASSASLIRSSPDYTISRGPTRENSWMAEDAISSEYPTPLSTEELVPPNPSFGMSASPHNSMASVDSSSSDVILDGNANMPASPSDMTHSVESSVSAQNSAYGSSVRARPPRSSRSRSRPMSMVSTAETTRSIRTTRSTNTLRGPAHSIHSNIQIVLPAPLAPELYPHMHPLAEGMSSAEFDRTSSFYNGSDRKSIADPWVLAGSRPQSTARFEREGSSSNSRLSSTGPRPSQFRPRSAGHSKAASTTSLRESDSASMQARRAQSQPPIPNAHAASRARTPSPGPGPRPERPARSSFVPLRSPLPPVPRVPSVYGRASVENAAYYGTGAYGAYPAPAPAPPSQEPARGRARGPVPIPVAAAAITLQSQVSVPPPSQVPEPRPEMGRRRESSGKLRKNRASTHGNS